jgi:hypothetical protein
MGSSWAKVTKVRASEAGKSNNFGVKKFILIAFLDAVERV